MKKLLFLFLLFIFIKNSFASHAAGADIQYAYLETDTFGNAKYKVTVLLYRDCTSLYVPDDINLNVKNIICNTNENYTLFKIDSQILNLYSPLFIGNSTCSSTIGTLPGYEKCVYSNIISIPDSCQSDYIISIEEGLRNSTNNISSFDGLYIEAIINNERNATTKLPLYSCSTASFITDPIIAVCNGSENTLLFMGIDPNGDSLTYELVSPLSNHLFPVTFNSPFSFQNPFNSPISFDSVKGSVIVTPTNIGTYSMAIKVKKYRNGKLINSVMRDIQVVVLNCNVVPITYHLSEIENVKIIDDATIGVCNNNFFSYKVNLGTTAFDQLKINRIIGDTSIFSNLSDTIIMDNNNTQSIVLNGFYKGNSSGTITVYYSRINGMFLMNYAQMVTVSPTTEKIMMDNNVYCGKPLLLKSISDNNIHWMPDSIFSNPFSKNTSLDLSNSTAQIIYLSTTCGTDSLWVKKGAPIPIVASPDTSLCTPDTVLLSVSIDSIYSSYSINWQLSGNKLIESYFSPNDSSNNPYVFISKNTLAIVKVTDSVGCYSNDTTNISLFPQFSIKEITDTFESHNFVKLTALQNLSPPNTSMYILPTDVSGISDAIIGAGTNIHSNIGSTYPSVYGSWNKSARHQLLIKANEINSINNVISSIALDIAVSNTLAPLEYFTIKIGETTLDSLTYFIENLLPVYSARYYNPVAGWNTHILKTAFNWDGKSNIIIDFCFTDSRNPHYTNSKLRYTSTSYKSFLYANDPSISVCSGYTAISNTVFNYQRPNVKLGMGYQIGTATFDSLLWYPNIGQNAVKDSINTITTACVSSDQTYRLIADNSFCRDTIYYFHKLATKPLIISQQNYTADSILFTSNYPIVNWYKNDSILGTTDTIYSHSAYSIKMDTPSTYEFYASYTDTNCNETFFSDTIKIAVYKPDTIIDSTVAINDLVLPIISLFPNPASNYCIAHIENMQKINAIKMTDIYGRSYEIFSVQNKNNNLLISWKNDITTGVYFIAFYTDTGISVKSIVVK